MPACPGSLLGRDCTPGTQQLYGRLHFRGGAETCARFGRRLCGEVQFAVVLKRRRAPLDNMAALFADVASTDGAVESLTLGKDSQRSGLKIHQAEHPRAFSSEVDNGSHEAKRVKSRPRSPVPIQKQKWITCDSTGVCRFAMGQGVRCGDLHVSRRHNRGPLSTWLTVSG